MSPAIVALIVFVPMLLEWRLSQANERALRAIGASEPPGDVHRTMAWAYPACFAAMVLEGVLAGSPDRRFVVAGATTFAAAKAIKYWAIATLGSRWTFRVLVPPDAPLVTGGPYAWIRHPNYVGVIGELLGVALLSGALVSGPLATAGFAWLVRRRIAVEDRALGRDQLPRKRV